MFLQLRNTAKNRAKKAQMPPQQGNRCPQAAASRFSTCLPTSGKDVPWKAQQLLWLSALAKWDLHQLLASPAATKATKAGVKLQVTCLLLALQCCHLGFWQPLSGQEEGACWSRLVSWNTWVEGKGLKGRQETLHSGLIPQCDFWERRGCNQAGCFLFGILGNRAQPDLHQEGNRAQPTLHETVTSPFILSHISPNDSDNIQIRHGERLGSLG